MKCEGIIQTRISSRAKKQRICPKRENCVYFNKTNRQIMSACFDFDKCSCKNYVEISLKALNKLTTKSKSKI